VLGFAARIPTYKYYYKYYEQARCLFYGDRYELAIALLEAILYD
jgi:hypothetical protein